MQEKNPTKLSAKQLRFVDEYLVDFNATAAAKRAGYSEKTAAVIGHENLRKPYISKHISEKVSALAMSSEEALIRISEFARSSLNEYFTIRQLPYTPKVEKRLAELIDDLRKEIEFEDKYAAAAGLSDKELETHRSAQQDRKRQIVRYEIEFEQNPNATRIVDGPTQLIDVPELDMAKLVADKEKGKIKSITPTQFGTKVELYAADAALINIAKILGLFEKDNAYKHEHTGKDGAPLQAPVTFISADSLTPEQLQEYIKAAIGDTSEL
ncbi:terminase small subunit [Dyadobacter sp. 676]|uniref:Terminase small subunit n=1 Tax=Dyadobacter sp. 676 TaxID=3088362 RepID=A0AAU8FQI4_9BACT